MPLLVTLAAWKDDSLCPVSWRKLDGTRCRLLWATVGQVLVYGLTNSVRNELRTCWNNSFQDWNVGTELSTAQHFLQNIWDASTRTESTLMRASSIELGEMLERQRESCPRQLQRSEKSLDLIMQANSATLRGINLSYLMIFCSWWRSLGN